MSRLVPLLLLASCSVVRHSRTSDDFERVDKQRLKRLAVVAQPFPEGRKEVAELFALVARRYVNQKRDFLVKESLAADGDFQLAPHCSEGIDGVLWLLLRMRTQRGVEAELESKLYRCPDGHEVWSAESGGSFPTSSEELADVTRLYAQELGEEVAPYVPAAFGLLRPTLDTLPNPVLTEADREEKIELGD